MDKLETGLTIFNTFMENLDKLSDLFLTGFIIERNLITGANTITYSGLTSPNGGYLKEWPANGPNGVNLALGNAFGTNTPTANLFYSGYYYIAIPLIGIPVTPNFYFSHINQAAYTQLLAIPDITIVVTSKTAS